MSQGIGGDGCSVRLFLYVVDVLVGEASPPLALEQLGQGSRGSIRMLRAKLLNRLVLRVDQFDGLGRGLAIVNVARRKVLE